MTNSSSPREIYTRRFSFSPGAYDFPKRGQPVHELFHITSDADVVERASERLDEAAERVRASRLKYYLFRQNSNSAVGCLLRTSGASPAQIDRLLDSTLFALRLPGIAFRLWSDEAGAEPPEGCSASD